MITYLTEGWYTRLGQRRLRNEVVDGAIDTASMLFRSAVPPEAITSLALKIRTLATLVDPPHRRGQGGGLGPHERAALVQRLQLYTDRYPALQSFINDCLEHVNDAMELRALYLHLVHVTQMMQLLMVAKLSGATRGMGLLSSPSPSPSLSEPARPAAKKKVAKKKVASKKPSKKKAVAPAARKATPSKPAAKKTKPKSSRK